MSLLDELIYGIKDVYVDGVLQPRRAAIDLVGGVARDNPARRLLEVDLGGSGGGGASLDRTLLVCPLTGDDATGGRGSPFETIQAALDAAVAGETVLVSPGEYDLGASGLTWPAVTGVTLMGMPGPAGRASSLPGGSVPVSVTLTNDGTEPVISGTLAADATAGLASLAVVASSSASPPTVLFTGAARSVLGLRDVLLATDYSSTDVALATDGVEIVYFDRALFVDGTDIQGASLVSVHASESIYLQKAPGQRGVTASPDNPCSVDFMASTGKLAAFGPVDVTVDALSTLDELSLDSLGAGPNAVLVRGTVERLSLGLVAGSASVDLRGANVVYAGITASGGTSRLRVDARGCRSRPHTPATWELDGPIDCDLAAATRVIALAPNGGRVDRDVAAEFTHAATEPAGGEFVVGIDPPFIGAPRDYRVDLETNYEVTTWVTDKTSSGFKVRYGAGVGGQISGAARLLGQL